MVFIELLVDERWCVMRRTWGCGVIDHSGKLREGHPTCAQFHPKIPLVSSFTSPFYPLFTFHHLIPSRNHDETLSNFVLIADVFSSPHSNTHARNSSCPVHRAAVVVMMGRREEIFGPPMSKDYPHSFLLSLKALSPRLSIGCGLWAAM